MDPALIDAVHATFPPRAGALTLGAVVHGGACHPEPGVALPLALMNRHGLVAGATATGKTRTLQRLAEQLSAAGVPVFVCDVEGGVSGIAAAGAPGERVRARAAETGYAWTGAGFPAEFLSLTGAQGALFGGGAPATVRVPAPGGISRPGRARSTPAASPARRAR